MLAASTKQKDFVWSVIPNLKDHTDLKLIYRASRDGWARVDFHRHCDNQGPTIILAKSAVGRICGGFTAVPWTSEEGWKNDNTAFLFSVDSELKFPFVKIGTTSVFHHAAGPSFSGCFNLLNMNNPNANYCYFIGSG